MHGWFYGCAFGLLQSVFILQLTLSIRGILLFNENSSDIRFITWVLHTKLGQKNSCVQCARKCKNNSYNQITVKLGIADNTLNVPMVCPTSRCPKPIGKLQNRFSSDKVYLYISSICFNYPQSLARGGLGRTDGTSKI